MPHFDSRELSSIKLITVSCFDRELEIGDHAQNIQLLFFHKQTKQALKKPDRPTHAFLL